MSGTYVPSVTVPSTAVSTDQAPASKSYTRILTLDGGSAYAVATMKCAVRSVALYQADITNGRDASSSRIGEPIYSGAPRPRPRISMPRELWKRTQSSACTIERELIHPTASEIT